MRVQRHLTGQILDLTDAAVLGFGPEARVLAVPGAEALAAKVYLRPKAAHERKLAAMLGNPPDAPRSPTDETSVAWPLDLLRATDGGRRVVGYLLEYPAHALPLPYLCAARVRPPEYAHFTYERLLCAAGHLAGAMQALHARGHVIGAVHPARVRVGKDTWVTLLDTDTFQVYDQQTGLPHPCPGVSRRGCRLSCRIAPHRRSSGPRNTTASGWRC